jgi:1,2-diacylglycerol 3-beta-galactosyltransferase
MKVEIIYFNAGGGHRSAASALKEVMEKQHRWEVVMTNLFDILDAKKIFQKVTKLDHEALYNKVLASGFTVGMGPQLKVLQAGIKTQRTSFVKKLRAHWSETQPDLVVSVIPNFNRAIGESLAMPFATVITDLCDLPPNFWIEPKLPNQHIIAGTEMAAAQAIVAGVPPARVHRVSGMVLRQSFYSMTNVVAGLAALGEEPAGLVMFGGIGSKVMLPIAKRLAHRRLVLVCGTNEKLRLQLEFLNNPLHEIIGYTAEIPSLMARCDYLIGKPGPGTISEAVHLGLPVIVSLNAFTMPQERWNTEWVLREDVGLVVKSFKQIDEAVAELLSRLPEMQLNTERFNNRAIFEIPEILKKLV